MEVFQNSSASIKCVRDSTKGKAVFHSTSSKTTGTLYFQINFKWINLTLCYYVSVGVDFSWCLSCEISFFFFKSNVLWQQLISYVSKYILWVQSKYAALLTESYWYLFLTSRLKNRRPLHAQGQWLECGCCKWFSIVKLSNSCKLLVRS